jgi:Flagellar biosynthesis pathway, component FliR
MDAATRMVVDGQQAFAMIGTVLWVGLRIGAMLLAMPLFGTRAVPGRVRALVALTLSLALAPVLPPVPVWNGFDAATVLTVLRELAIGVTIGFTLRLVFEVGSLAGELISQGTGLAFAQMTDPARGGSSSVIGQWFYLLFGLLFFAANGHLALISLLMDSYKVVPIGTSLPDAHSHGRGRAQLHAAGVPGCGQPGPAADRGHAGGKPGLRRTGTRGTRAQPHPARPAGLAAAGHDDAGPVVQ